MDDMKEYRFRLLKSSWGILICFKWKKCVNFTEWDGYKIKNASSKVIILVNGKLNDDFVDSIINGINWTLKDIDVLKERIIVLSDIEFNFSDFQEDAMFYAGASWIRNVLDLPVLNYDVYFSGKDNKYIFPQKENETNWKEK